MSGFFNNKLPPSCAYCMHSEAGLTGEYFCRKHGVTRNGDSCRRYRYDPLKRQPQKPKVADGYKPEDFSLE